MIANKISEEKREKIVVITQGKDPVIVAKSDSEEILYFPVPQLNPTEIVDTNGAGDAFVGGYLAQLTDSKPFDSCIRTAIICAKEILKRPGCSLPNFKFSYANTNN